MCAEMEYDMLAAWQTVSKGKRTRGNERIFLEFIGEAQWLITNQS